MTAIVVIENREAIPVRAIPFVTGWKMPPDKLAWSLAHRDDAETLEGVTAEHLLPDGQIPLPATKRPARPRGRSLSYGFLPLRPGRACPEAYSTCASHNVSGRVPSLWVREWSGGPRVKSMP